MSRARGTKDEVYEGIALRTAGGLYAADLTLNKRGKVVSFKQSQSAQDRFPAFQEKMCNAVARRKAAERNIIDTLLDEPRGLARPLKPTRRVDAEDHLLRTLGLVGGRRGGRRR